MKMRVPVVASSNVVLDVHLRNAEILKLISNKFRNQMLAMGFFKVSTEVQQKEMIM